MAPRKSAKEGKGPFETAAAPPPQGEEGGAAAPPREGEPFETAAAPPREGEPFETAAAPPPQGEGAEESDGLKMAATLRGDIRDRLLALIRGMAKPWAETDEKGQAAIAEACGSLAERLIFGVIEIVHAEGAPSLRMTVDGVSFKKGIKVSLSGSRGDPNRHLLADATDTDVLIVLDNAMRFMGEASPAPVEPDQRALDIDHPQAER